jgi:RimJ/RimL family protein N-acetyltransferase
MVTGKRIRLRRKRLDDAIDNYAWQTDAELTQLDAAPLLSATFPRYLSAYLEELRYPSPKRRTFAIETREGKHIGNCSYYDINENKGETQLGILIGERDYWNKGYGTEAVSLLLSHIFQETKLNRVYLKTQVSNIRAQRCFQKCGFALCGTLNKDGYHFVLMDMHRRQWAQQKLKNHRARIDTEGKTDDR